jgi:hypothetical protein
MGSVREDLGAPCVGNPAKGIDGSFASVAINRGPTAPSATAKVLSRSPMATAYGKATHYGAGVSGVGTEAI